MPGCVIVASAKIPAGRKMKFHLALNKTFCTNPRPLTHRPLKHHQRTKINKTMFLLPPQRFSTQNSQYQN